MKNIEKEIRRIIFDLPVAFSKEVEEKAVSQLVELVKKRDQESFEMGYKTALPLEEREAKHRQDLEELKEWANKNTIEYTFHRGKEYMVDKKKLIAKIDELL